MSALKQEEIQMLMAPIKERRGERRVRKQVGGEPFARVVDGKIVDVEKSQRIRNDRRRGVVCAEEPEQECDGWHPEAGYKPSWQKRLMAALCGPMGRLP